MVRNAYCKTDGVLRLWGLLPTVCVFHFRAAAFNKTYFPELATRGGTVGQRRGVLPEAENLPASGRDRCGHTRAVERYQAGLALRGKDGGSTFRQPKILLDPREAGAMRGSLRGREAGPLCWVRGGSVLRIERQRWPCWIAKNYSWSAFGAPEPLSTTTTL